MPDVSGSVGLDPATSAVAFVRLLRQVGIDVPVDATARFVEALDVVDVASPDDVYWSARATPVSYTHLTLPTIYSV